MGGRVHLLVYLVAAAAFSKVAALTRLVYKGEAVESAHNPPIAGVDNALRRVAFTCTQLSLHDQAEQDVVQEAIQNQGSAYAVTHAKCVASKDVYLSDPVCISVTKSYLQGTALHPRYFTRCQG